VFSGVSENTTARSVLTKMNFIKLKIRARVSQSTWMSGTIVNNVCSKIILRYNNCYFIKIFQILTLIGRLIMMENSFESSQVVHFLKQKTCLRNVL